MPFAQESTYTLNHSHSRSTAAGSSKESSRSWFDLGNAAVDRGDLYRAIGCYRRAIDLQPHFPEAQFNLGVIYRSLGSTGDAASCFRRAAKLKPDYTDAHYHLAELLISTGDAQASAEHYRAALRCNPSLAAAHNNLGNILKAQGDFQSAVECFRNVVRLRPGLAEGHYNLGSALKDAGDLDAAAAALGKAIQLRPGYAEAWNNLGLAEKGRARYKESIDCFSHALQLKPDMAEARWNRAFVHLLNGNFACGWQDFEARHDLPQWKLFYPFRLTTPRWDGIPHPRGTILVHDEQGLGDTLQFVRYLPWVKERVAKVILETQAPLIRLLEGLSGVDMVMERPAASPDHSIADLHIPLMSLPRIFGTLPESIPAVVPYIWPDLEKVRAWSNRITGPRLKVGIVWAGRPEHHNDRNRSCRLQQFAPLAGIPGIGLFSLQKGPAVSQIQDAGLQDAIINLDPELNDFTDTAAAISRLDLVISVDTSVAHLAGAMGKPVWVLLPNIPDWRWMLQRKHSPWYPTMRLFRQRKAEEWGPVFLQVEASLHRRLQEKLESSTA